jgi:hypothetical protein
MQGTEGGGMYYAPETGLKMDEFTLGLVLLEMCTNLMPSDTYISGDTLGLEREKTVKKHILEGHIPLSAIPTDLRLLTPRY